MKPNFYARNLTVNSLIDLLEKDFVWDYYEKISGQTIWNIPNYDVQHYNDLLPLLENEINQTIFSGNTHYIRTLFEDLKERKQYFLSIKKDDILHWVNQWNEEWYKEYEEKVKEQTDKYFANEKTKGLKHLDAYNDFRYVGPGFFLPPISEHRYNDWKEVEVTYYGFYCIDDISQKWAKYINSKELQPYFNLIVDEMKKFVNLVDKYIARYEAGEYISAKPEETWVDKQIRRFKNNKISGIIILIVLGLSAPYGIIRLGMDIYKATQEEKVALLITPPLQNNTPTFTKTPSSTTTISPAKRPDSLKVDTNKIKHGH